MHISIRLSILIWAEEISPFPSFLGHPPAGPVTLHLNKANICPSTGSWKLRNFDSGCVQNWVSSPLRQSLHSSFCIFCLFACFLSISPAISDSFSKYLWEWGATLNSEENLFPVLYLFSSFISFCLRQHILRGAPLPHKSMAAIFLLRGPPSFPHASDFNCK